MSRTLLATRSALVGGTPRAVYGDRRCCTRRIERWHMGLRIPLLWPWDLGWSGRSVGEHAVRHAMSTLHRPLAFSLGICTGPYGAGSVLFVHRVLQGACR